MGSTHLINVCCLDGRKVKIGDWKLIAEVAFFALEVKFGGKDDVLV